MSMQPINLATTDHIIYIFKRLSGFLRRLDLRFWYKIMRCFQTECNFKISTSRTLGNAQTCELVKITYIHFLLGSFEFKFRTYSFSRPQITIQDFYTVFTSFCILK